MTHHKSEVLLERCGFDSEPAIKPTRLGVTSMSVKGTLNGHPAAARLALVHQDVSRLT